MPIILLKTFFSIESMNKLSICFPVIYLFMFLAACSSEPELDKKTRLLRLIQTMEENIEAKALDDFMDSVSEDFTLTSRGYNKKDAERMLRIRLMRNKNVHVHHIVKQIDWLEDGENQATVEIVAALAGTDFSLSDMPSFRGEMAKFNVTFELNDGEYVITKTTWQRATPADFVF